MHPVLERFLSSGRYLPRCLRDFHDQKRMFKRIDQMVQHARAKESTRHTYEGYNWVMAHCYTIDKFLWFMAAHGYTLQRTRNKTIPFCDLEATMRAFEEEQRELLAQEVAFVRAQEGD